MHFSEAATTYDVRVKHFASCPTEARGKFALDLVAHFCSDFDTFAQCVTVAPNEYESNSHRAFVGKQIFEVITYGIQLLLMIS